MISSSPLPLLYHNRMIRTSHRGGGGSGVISGSPLPLVYHNRIVEHLIGEGGELGVGWLVGPLCHWYIITE